MIISASRRTDIPALYSEWLLGRLREGFALMPNPRNQKRLGRVELSPDIVDCIVFWTKNAEPMLPKLSKIESMGYSFYFQFTLTPYDSLIEQGLPPKERLMQTFAALSKLIGSRRVVWRYDPVIVDENMTVNWHIQRFSEMCERLHPYTSRCVLSFVDPYKSLGNNFRALSHSEMLETAHGFSNTAGEFDIELYTCAEEIELSEYGIGRSACIEQKLIEQITGSSISAKRDTNQRPNCRCIESVDIGAYDTCTNGCSYCYATVSRNTALRRFINHDPNAPMITGYPKGDEIITDRTRPSLKSCQLRLI